jgi:putative ATP-dependent endonuclease of the OLD family
LKIYSLSLRNFRGMSSFELIPARHALVTGEPRAGRSTVVDALYRVLSPNGSRGTVGHDLDFSNRDQDLWAEAEVALGDLDDDLTQRFFDQLEFWDPDEEQLIDELDATGDLDAYEPVVRLCYRLRWNSEQEIGEQWVDYPKFADPDNDSFSRVRRADLEALPVFFGRGAGAPLSLAHESNLRWIIDGSSEEDFKDTLESFAAKVELLGDELVESNQLMTALRKIIEPVSSSLALDTEELSDEIGFVPAGVALGALLRGLEPTMTLGDEESPLPLSRHGSTVSTALAAAELLVRGQDPGGLVVFDDFGEALDGPTSRHLASLLRLKAQQAWITTRRAEVADAFKPNELVRLAFDEDGERAVYQGRQPRSKSERMAARHLSLQILPVITARAVVIVEGPHDRAGLQAIAERRLRKEGVPLLSGERIGLIDAGAADSAGGSSALPRLCKAAGELGFYTVAVLDGDPDGEDALQATDTAADAVVRLPEGIAIELALLDGLTDEAIQTAFSKLDVHLPPDFADLEGNDLVKAATRALKSRGGVHAEFVDALRGPTPKLAARVLDEAMGCVANGSAGVVQL